MRTQSKNRKATKSMGKCSFSCHLLSLPSNWYIVFFSCIIEIMVIFLLRLNGEHGYRTFNHCFDQSETWSVYANHRYTSILLVWFLWLVPVFLHNEGEGGWVGWGNFSWGELTQTGGQSVLGQHDDGATIFSWLKYICLHKHF